MAELGKKDIDKKDRLIQEIQRSLIEKEKVHLELEQNFESYKQEESKRARNFSNDKILQCKDEAKEA